MHNKNQNGLKVLFLVINYMPHQLVSIKSLVNTYKADVHSIAKEKNPLVPCGNEFFYSYKLSDFSREELWTFIQELEPNLMVVAGWAVRDFVWAAKKAKKHLKIPIVSYSDTQWRNTLRQNINSAISRWYLKKAFTHLWVAGIFQYYYAKKLGFSNDRIVYNSLSCDTGIFYQCSMQVKKSNYPKNFLYVGRFVDIKGLGLLMEAWNNISDKKGWQLILVGEGPLKEKFQGYENVIIKDFMSQDQLVVELENSGCFVLPSTFEQWALVIHEASAAGLPILATDVCGATPHFVISGYNGYQMKPTVHSIQDSMENIINKDIDQLLIFSENSRVLSRSVSPEIGSAQLMSTLNGEWA
jgi:glycosyltransferase involved in cell wall biosynthesis